MVRHVKGSCGPFESSACMHVWLKDPYLLDQPRFPQLHFVPHLMWCFGRRFLFWPPPGGHPLDHLDILGVTC